MAKVRMTATKGLTYATRRLRAGDEFDAAGADARVLEAAELARRSDVPKVTRRPAPMLPVADLPSAPAPDLPSGEEGEIASLAAEYERLTGSAPDGRWRAGRLEREIENFKESSSPVDEA